MSNQHNTKDTHYLISDTSIPSSKLSSLPAEIVDRTGDFIKLRFEGKIYNALVKSMNLNEKIKSAKININGYDYDVAIKEPIDQLIDELGFLTKTKQSVKEVKSMMPGLVVTIFVKVGDLVEDGDKLLSLEAMKMENIIKSPSSGVVKAIHVSPKQALEKNQLLVSFE